jgi:hypothetical protein
MSLEGKLVGRLQLLQTYHLMPKNRKTIHHHLRLVLPIVVAESSCVFSWFVEGHTSVNLGSHPDNRWRMSVLCKKVFVLRKVPAFQNRFSNFEECGNWLSSSICLCNSKSEIWIWYPAIRLRTVDRRMNLFKLVYNNEICLIDIISPIECQNIGQQESQFGQEEEHNQELKN